MTDTTRDDWDEVADGWDANADVRNYSGKAFDSWARKVAPLLPDLCDRRVLDIGCGTGLLTEKLAPLCGRVVAIDTSAKMIDVLQNKVTERGIGNVVALQVGISAATTGQYPELAGKFDLIVASSVCSFLPDYGATLRDLVCLMNPGAIFVQWDWLADMPVDRIQAAYAASGLQRLEIAEAFAIGTGEETMPVVMGIGRFPA